MKRASSGPLVGMAAGLFFSTASLALDLNRDPAPEGQLLIGSEIVVQIIIDELMVISRFFGNGIKQCSIIDHDPAFLPRTTLHAFDIGRHTDNLPFSAHTLNR